MDSHQEFWRLLPLMSLVGERGFKCRLGSYKTKVVVTKYQRSVAFVGRMQIEEFAAGMRHAVDFSDELLEACFAAVEIIAP